MDATPKPVEREKVIVRAYGDEPVRLKAIAVRAGRVEVARTDESKSMLYWSALVYRFTPDLFEQLRDAYNAKDTVALRALWQKAEHYVGTYSA